jgi:hypothetical protein
LVVWVKVAYFSWARALIDSGCTGNFMSPEFAKKNCIGTTMKKEPFLLMGFDRKPMMYNNSIVSRETEKILLEIGRYQGKIQFDITDAPGCDVVLGLPWLKESNLRINWSEETIQFGNSSLVWLKTVGYKPPDIKELFAMSATELRKAIAENPDQVQVLYCKKTEVKQGPALDIPPEYSDFKHLFEKEADEDALPPHQP